MFQTTNQFYNLLYLANLANEKATSFSGDHHQTADWFMTSTFKPLASQHRLTQFLFVVTQGSKEEDKGQVGTFLRIINFERSNSN